MRYIYCALALTLIVTVVYVVLDPFKSFKHEESGIIIIDAHVLNQFQSYARDFKKNYTDTDYLKRLQNFQASLKEISRLNSLHGGKKVYGLTKFSDMSADEFQRKMLSGPFLGGECKPMNRKGCPHQLGMNISDHKRAHRLHKQKTVDVNHKSFNLKELPDKVDWRKRGVVFPVLNQGVYCRACWAFSIIGVMESMAAIHGMGMTRLSIQELIDCSTYNNGCLGGDLGSALDFLCSKDYPIVTEARYPLKLVTETCKMPHGHKPAGRKIKSYESSCNVNEELILQLLAEHGPVLAVVNAANWMNYDGGVIHTACVSTWHYMNHVVQIEGYDMTNDVPYYIVRNSFGKSFGDDGYVKLAIGQNVCGIANNIGHLTVV